MSGLKLPKDTDEMQEDSSDNESVLEKPKKSTAPKEKKPYVMTEKRRLNCEKMREAQNVNVDHNFKKNYEIIRFALTVQRRNYEPAIMKYPVYTLLYQSFRIIL